MGNAPTRPPGRPRMDGRRPRGHRVTRPWRERLQKAANVLRADGHEEEALDVEAVLAPGAWNWLREIEPTQGGVVKMPLTMDVRLKNAIAQAAEDRSSVPSAVVAEGFRAFLSGEFVPPRVVRAAGNGYSKTTMTVTVPRGLRDQVAAKIPQVAEEAGYRITLSSIAVEWLLDQLGVERLQD